MQEILFRGKRVDGLGWAYGDLLTEYIHHEGWTIVHGGCVYFEVDPETVGQYTGLQDKNGVKIFEGDIVRFRETHSDTREVRQVAWMGESDYPAFDFKPHLDCDCNGLSYAMAVCDEVDVIGNIHDNPELLEVE